MVCRDSPSSLNCTADLPDSLGRHRRELRSHVTLLCEGGVHVVCTGSGPALAGVPTAGNPARVNHGGIPRVPPRRELVDVCIRPTLGLRVDRPEPRITHGVGRSGAIAVLGEIETTRGLRVKDHVTSRRVPRIERDVVGSNLLRRHPFVCELLGAVSPVIVRSVTLVTPDHAAVGEPVAGLAIVGGESVNLAVVRRFRARSLAISSVATERD
mmetsp:Transcript_21091/g.54893  ORF Transcript_21091/g.54893 Transcript_21091/m.54893 type:complete len:212 (+) Transcript_21091:585-1220(+)